MNHESMALNEQRALTQKTLIDFLEADLDLCFTILNTAQMASEPAHYHSALEHVRRGLQVIRHLAGRIENPESSKSVNSRADELERTFESVRGPFHPEHQSTNT